MSNTINIQDAERDMRSDPFGHIQSDRIRKQFESRYTPAEITRLADIWAPFYARQMQQPVADVQRAIIRDFQQMVALTLQGFDSSSPISEQDSLQELERRTQLADQAEALVERWHEAYFEGRPDPYARSSSISSPSDTPRPHPTTRRILAQTQSVQDATRNVISSR